MKFSTFSRKTYFFKNYWNYQLFRSLLGVKLWRKTSFSLFSDFFIFIIEKDFFHKKITKIIKNCSFPPEAPDALKTNVLGKVLRPKSWKSLNSWNFINFQLFLELLVFMKKLIFMISGSCYAVFSHFGPKKVMLEQCFQPSGEFLDFWWNLIKFQEFNGI